MPTPTPTPAPTLYNHNGIIVTPTLLTIPGGSYTLTPATRAEIRTTGLYEVSPVRKWLRRLLLLAGIVVAFVYSSACGPHVADLFRTLFGVDLTGKIGGLNDQQVGAVIAAAGIVLLSLIVAAFVRLRTRIPQHALILSDAAGQRQILSSRNHSEIQTLHQALTKALQHR
ncbi:MAG: DUF6232 family protein [Planctomycetota bacterium]